MTRFAGLMACLVLAGCAATPEAAPAPTPASEPAPQPALKGPFALQPGLAAGRSWSQTVKATSTWKLGPSGMKSSYDFAMKAEVLEATKAGAPTRVAFRSVWGDQGFERSGRKPERRSFTSGSIEAQVDPAGRLTAPKVRSMSDDVLLVWPAGPLGGFVPPEKPVEVGATWGSKDLVPAGPRTLRKRQFTFHEPQGEFRLVELSGTVARIEWTGSATVKEPKRGRGGKATWSRVVRFDVPQARVLSSEGLLTLDFGGLVITHDVAVRATD